jgi:hypothetical protein
MPSAPDPGGDAARLRSVLICHAESRLNREAVARWLNSFTDLAGIVLIEERGTQARNRVRFEVKRIGWLRFLDVLAFRLYYGLVLGGQDDQWLTRELDRVERRFPPLPGSVRVLRTADPNAPAVREFLAALAPDLAIARCKRILREPIFAAPRLGTFVLHPGVCPEYRNAHGAFWALAEDDLDRVGLTLLKIDKGVDTGPVYGYFTVPLDEVNESHIVLMTRLVTENFDRIRDRLLAVAAGTAARIDTTGRPAAVWGQPWLTKYLRWKRAARRRNAGAVARIS